MGYFKAIGLLCDHYPGEWRSAIRGIQGWRNKSGIPAEISTPLEAKALSVFTISRRLIRTAKTLEKSPKGWKPVFIEATILLFPMIELIGHCRIDPIEVKNVFGHGRGVSAVNIWAGLQWLLDPDKQVTIKDRNQRRDKTLLDRWQIGHLVSLRHYLLHGSKHVILDGYTITTEDILSFQFPGFVIERSVKNLSHYWDQLRMDNGNAGWAKRLASADVRPLRIQGSKLSEDALIDPDIVECLNGQKRFY
jgi:hypothetical protein